VALRYFVEVQNAEWQNVNFQLRNTKVSTSQIIYAKPLGYHLTPAVDPLNPAWLSGVMSTFSCRHFEVGNLKVGVLSFLILDSDKKTVERLLYTSKSNRMRTLQAGWPDAFVKKNRPKCSPNNFLQKNDAKLFQWD
jgi:hypothetical protein